MSNHPKVIFIVKETKKVELKQQIENKEIVAKEVCNIERR